MSSYGYALYVWRFDPDHAYGGWWEDLDSHCGAGEDPVDGEIDEGAGYYVDGDGYAYVKVIAPAGDVCLGASSVYTYCVTLEVEACA